MTQRTEDFLAKLPIEEDSNFILNKIATILARKERNISISVIANEAVCFEFPCEIITWGDVLSTIKLFLEKNVDKSKLLRLSYTEDNSINLGWAPYSQFIGDKPMEMNDEFINLLQFAL